MALLHLGEPKPLRWLCYGLQRRTYIAIINSTGYVQSLRHLSVLYVLLILHTTKSVSVLDYQLSVYIGLGFNSALFSFILHPA